MTYILLILLNILYLFDFIDIFKIKPGDKPATEVKLPIYAVFSV